MVCNDCDDNDPDLNANDEDSDGVDTCANDCNDTDDEMFPGNAEECNSKDSDVSDSFTKFSSCLVTVLTGLTCSAMEQ